MPKTVLIIGQVSDPHIGAVRTALIQLGAKVFIFDRLRSQQGCQLSYHLGTTCVFGVLDIDGQLCDLSEVDAVWWRVKPTTYLNFPESNPATTSFIHREWDSALNSLEAFTRQSRWINPRLSDLQARNKPTQLFIARKLGFTIPLTIISNDNVAIERFLESGEGGHIYKPLTWYFDPPDKIIFTSQVDANQIRSDPDAIHIAPGIFQVRIPKAYEVRATLIGKEIFTVRIDSQSHQETSLDWRRSHDVLSYEKISLPDDVEKRLFGMNNQLGLMYAAYDLVVTPSGEYVFLEVNQAGQWLWLEDAIGIPISQSLARALIE